jgi:hypothetical protein
MKCPVCGTPWTMLDKSPAHPFGGWVTHCPCQHVVPGSPLYPPLVCHICGQEITETQSRVLIMVGKWPQPIHRTCKEKP